MTKLASLALLAFVSPALADTAAPPPRAAYSLGIALKGKAIARTHAIAVAADDCAETSEAEKNHHDQIKVCALTEAPDRILLRIEWSSHDGPNEYRGKQSLVVARGTQHTIGSPTSTHLVVDVK